MIEYLLLWEWIKIILNTPLVSNNNDTVIYLENIQRQIYENQISSNSPKYVYMSTMKVLTFQKYYILIHIIL